MLPSESFRMRASLIKEFLNVTENVENVIEVKKLSPEDRTVDRMPVPPSIGVARQSGDPGIRYWP